MQGVQQLDDRSRGLGCLRLQRILTQLYDGFLIVLDWDLCFL